MITPRNSLVVLKLIELPERQVGKIVVPSQADQFCEAEVLAVGPGTVAAQGGVSETADLRVGQRVWVKHKTRTKGPMGEMLVSTGIAYQQNDETFVMFEQTQIVAVIAEPATQCFSGPRAANN